MAAGRLDASGVWDLEDEEVLAAARDLIEQQSGIVIEANGNHIESGTIAGRSNGIGLPGR
jgi:hypothetical protein